MSHILKLGALDMFTLGKLYEFSIVPILQMPKLSLRVTWNIVCKQQATELEFKPWYVGL